MTYVTSKRYVAVATLLLLRMECNWSTRLEKSNAIEFSDVISVSSGAYVGSK